METTSQSSAAVAPQGNPLVTKVKALLMRAWRERWNEIQWGVQLKKVIAVTPGDSKELAGRLQREMNRVMKIPTMWFSNRCDTN